MGPDDSGLPVSNSELNELDVLAIWQILWRRKWLILSIGTVSVLCGVAYALMATEWYRAEVLLSPAKQNNTSTLSGQLGSFASLAGVNISDSGDPEALATLESRRFTRSFIEDEELMPILFYDQWDHENSQWKVEDLDEQPDVRDAIQFFDESVLSIQEDRDTGLVTLTIEWVDPDLAADWANMLVTRLNDRMRQRALAEAEANVEYLQQELAGTTVVALQQSIGRLLETELQRLMLARGTAEFSFRVIDDAEPPKYRARPNRPLIVLVAAAFGGILAALTALIIQAASTRNSRSRE